MKNINNIETKFMKMYNKFLNIDINEKYKLLINGNINIAQNIKYQLHEDIKRKYKW